ncbi:PEP-CTERM sorting domain-containing protein [Sphingomonas panacisoli]|uniref:PEP-CTERM sorting domain-containing protein n=1 Tax=Sphingomonas panacisoli TaxID=1813879 RepID=A0A5B8LJU7_9SPHN|nr:PEPxxWA-CTERM sorting domain-containing protein [Sphingomonas panacisoli]QDZ08169.1 PEP-CTERM sorting domain-containing protein [Sphingomonas panacisoli]
MRYLTPVILAAAIAPVAASAQTALSTANYVQNFDTLASTGTSSTLPAGWAISETGTAADGAYAAGDGSSNSGNTYSFGATGSTERALGSVGSGAITQAQYGVLFTNQLGSTITAFDIAYIGEQWRLGNSTDDGLTFEYSTNATSLTSGTWTRFSALDFLPAVTSGTQGALNGNLAANQRSLATTIGGLSILSGANFGFRWTDLNSGGNDHGLAVDNFSLKSTLATGAVPEPATWGMIILGFGAMAGAVRRRGRVAQRVRFA